MSLNEVIQENYVNLIKMTDAIPLLDHLYESDSISHNEYGRLGKQFQTDRESANRDLFNIIMRRQSIDLDYFERILFQTKQNRLLELLFPYKYASKSKSKYQTAFNR